MESQFSISYHSLTPLQPHPPGQSKSGWMEIWELHPDGTEEMLEAALQPPTPTTPPSLHQPVFKLIQCKPKGRLPQELPHADMRFMPRLRTPICIELPSGVVRQTVATRLGQAGKAFTARKCRAIDESADEGTDGSDAECAEVTGDEEQIGDQMGIDAAGVVAEAYSPERADLKRSFSHFETAEGEDVGEGLTVLNDLASSLEDCQVISPSKRPALAASDDAKSSPSSTGVPSAPPPSPVGGRAVEMQ